MLLNWGQCGNDKSNIVARAKKKLQTYIVIVDNEWLLMDYDLLLNIGACSLYTSTLAWNEGLFSGRQDTVKIEQLF